MSDAEFKKRFPTQFDPEIYAECKRVRMRVVAMYYAFGFLGVTTALLFTLIGLLGFGIIELPESIVLSLASGTVLEMGASVVILYRFLFARSLGHTKRRKGSGRESS